MPYYPESGRQVALTLLDIVIASQRMGGDDLRSADRGVLAAQRINEIPDAVSTYLDEDGRPHARIGNLVGGALILSDTLLKWLASVEGKDLETMVAEVRTMLEI